MSAGSVGALFHIDHSQVSRYVNRTFGEAGYRRFLDEMTGSFLKSAEIARDSANDLIKGGRDSNLAKSAKVAAQVSGTEMQSTVTWTARHARWVNDGRGPVVAQTARALRFVIDGEVFFRKRVGPAPAQHYVERGLQAARPGIRRELNAGVARWVAWAGAG